MTTTASTMTDPTTAMATTMTTATATHAPTAVATDPAPFVRAGWWLVVAGFGGFLAWAALAPLDKGVPLSGTVTVETSRKAVQHEVGGTVEAIMVRDGASVKAGDVLVRMNAVQSSADYETVRVQYFTARATEARLLAERDGADRPRFAPDMEGARGDTRAAEAMRLQSELFRARSAALRSELASIDEGMVGLAAQLRAMDDGGASKRRQLALLDEQVTGLRGLAGSGYVSRHRLLELEQAQAQLGAELAELSGNASRARGQLAELRLRRQQRIEEHQKEVRAQLSDAQRDAAALASRLTGLDRTLRNHEVRAPVDGTVMGLSVFTRGAVVPAGFRLMDIVPEGDPLVVEGRLPVHLVDKVYPGLSVSLTFTAFDRNATPELSAEVEHVSADRFEDERTGEPYYKVRTRVSAEEMGRIGQLKVRAGMPVDMFVKTGERTALNYLLKPLADHMRTAMTEE
jgi:protease secretion system membrane fusion protein